MTQAMLPALRAAHGRILFISSVGGRVAMAFTAPYAASKHAVEAFGDALRVELPTSGVQVALIEPGSVATPIWDKARETGDQIKCRRSCRSSTGTCPQAMDKALQDTAKRGVPPEQVAETIERALAARAHEVALCRRARRARDDRRRRCCPTTCSTASPSARSASSVGQRGPGRGEYVQPAAETASQANRLVVAACVCSMPGRALLGASVSPFQDSRYRPSLLRARVSALRALSAASAYSVRSWLSEYSASIHCR